MIKAFKYRIYPTKEQQSSLNKHFGCCRYIYNWGLDLSNKLYKEKKKSFFWTEIANEIPKLKKQEDTKWLKEVNSQSLQSAIKNLDKAFSRFFKKQGKFPQFKSKRDKQSFQIPQNLYINKEKSIISIPKVDGEIKTVFHRDFKGEIGTTTISKNKANQYFVSIQVEIKETPKNKEKPCREKSIGIDLGIKDFAVLSNGERIANPNITKKYEDRLSKLQKDISRKQKDSNNRKKSIVKFAKLWQHITDKKNDFLHKLSHKIVSENKTICLEDLNVAEMLKNHNLAKSISRVSWGEFIRQLKYKSEWNGVNVIEINMFSPSSKMCNNCGDIKKNLTLKDRVWACKNCGFIIDRDLNASKNILDFCVSS